MQIEALTANNAQQIIHLYKKELKQLGLLGSVYQSPKAANYIGFLCENHLEHFYGLNLDKEVIAAIQLKQITASIHINNMVVDAKLRGKGYGSMLMQQAIKLAQNKELLVSLDVDSENKKALDWYLHLGFETIHQKQTSIFKLQANTTIQPQVLDAGNLAKFGFSEVSMPTSEAIKLFFIQPNVYRLDSPVLLSKALLAELNSSINGLLLVNSKQIGDANLASAYLTQKSYRMVKNEI